MNYKKRPIFTDEFIKRAHECFKESSNYTYVEYYSMRTEIKIICPAYGMFQQKPINHLTGAGCHQCAF